MKNSEKKDVFELHLFRKINGEASKKKLHALLIPELCALTLLNNRDAIHLMLYLAHFVKGSLEIPNTISGQDSWFSRWAEKSGSPGCYQNSATERKSLRKEILASNAEPNKQAEHISIRAYPVCYHSPQTPKGSTTTRLLLVAYHLERDWARFQLEPLSSQYMSTSIENITLTPDLIEPEKWEKFAWDTQQTLWPENNNRIIFFHTPEGSKLENVLTYDGINVIDDMPPAYAGKERFDLTVYTRSTKLLQIIYINKLTTSWDKPDATTIEHI